MIHLLNKQNFNIFEDVSKEQFLARDNKHNEHINIPGINEIGLNNEYKQRQSQPRNLGNKSYAQNNVSRTG